MKYFAGLWIDHRKAIIVIIDNREAKLTVIPSHVERQFGREDGIRTLTAFESLQFPADDNADRGIHQRIIRFLRLPISFWKWADNGTNPRRIKKKGENDAHSCKH